MRTQLRSQAPLVAAGILICGAAALLATIGADARWLAALGRIIVHRDEIPQGVPFAAAPTRGWPNVPVLAELAFDGLERSLGDRGLMIAQLAAVAAAAAILGRDALASGGNPRSAARALLLAGIGSLPSLAIARVQLFSLVLFPLLIGLIRAEARRPSGRIWLAVPLLAVWSNLHGAAVMGLGILLTYLVLVRLREQRGLAIAVGVAACVAMCLTPAGIHTIAYYHGVITNAAASRGAGLWARLSLRDPLDDLMIVSAAALIAPLRRIRPDAWELVVLIALAGLTVHASRSGVWLLFFLVAPAARAIRPGRSWEYLLPLIGVTSLVVLGYSLARGPLKAGEDQGLVAEAVRFAHGKPILGPDILEEEAVLAGGRIWVGNPIDAFRKRDQAAYLDWLEGAGSGREAIVRRVDVVITATPSEQRVLAAVGGFARITERGQNVLYLRSTPTE